MASEPKNNDHSTEKSNIIDNHSRGAIGKYLKNELESDDDVSIVSAYFTIYAYEQLKEQLDTVKRVRFLFGEPTFIHPKNLNPKLLQAENFRLEKDEVKLANATEMSRIARECYHWIQDKVEIRSMVKPNFLHGKMFYLKHPGGVEHAIVGSSNFTVNGLGLGHSSNKELNIKVDVGRDREDLLEWFDEIWDDGQIVQDVKDEVLNYLQKVYQPYSPEFIYYKTLFHLFQESLEDRRNQEEKETQKSLEQTQIWHKLYDFQKDAVRGSINKMNQYNGCVIADSVGLGKTFEALAVIKYFQIQGKRVLVLAPKRLRPNWTQYLENVKREYNPLAEDGFHYTVLSHTDLTRTAGEVDGINLEKFNWSDFGLVVIDESHNFRNITKGRTDEQGRRINKSRYEKLLEDVIQKGARTKVLMLSATPVNTSLTDLRNQVYFMTGAQEEAFRDSLDIANMQNFFADMQRRFVAWGKDESANRKPLAEVLGNKFFNLLDEISIARSRNQIVKHYDTSAIGPFPERENPRSIDNTEIDSKNHFPPFEKIDDEISKYKLSLFSPFAYVKENKRTIYENKAGGPRNINFSQGDREHYLIGMMKINFLKRLESSIHAFRLTMESTVQKIDRLIDKINDYKENKSAGTYQADEAFANDKDQEEYNHDDEELDEALLVGGKLKFRLADIQLDKWLKDLREDRYQINNLAHTANDVTPARDGKLQKLKAIVKDKVQNPTTNRHGQANPKVLIFTAFADTALYLYDNMSKMVAQELKHQIAMVTGGGGTKTSYGRNSFEDIILNFSPRSKERKDFASGDTKGPQKPEIDVLIATDTLSEGQNLQDCDMVINYDIHWNPVRIIQRFGRIDRIGSQNSTVKMTNFWPVDDLNKYLNLRKRVEDRMHLVDMTASSQEDILQANHANAPNQQEQQDGIEQGIKYEQSYRDDQLLRLKEEVLDLSANQDGISMQDFSLDEFRSDLFAYIQKNRKELEEAPDGVFALVPSPEGQYKKLDTNSSSIERPDSIGPGLVVFLEQRGLARLKEKSSQDSGSKNDPIYNTNPIAPYYLLYITKDKVIKRNFDHPKAILSIMRELSLNRSTPYEQLEDIFNKETNNGRQMEEYSHLVKAGLDGIRARFGDAAAHNAQKSLDGLIPDVDRQPSVNDFEFDLITWQIIM